MKEVSASLITQTVARLCQEANTFLPDDVLAALRKAREAEESALGREVLDQILENAGLATREGIPLCQDCGSAVVFMEVGQEVHIVGGSLAEAVAEGVRLGYGEGRLRRSVVSQPFSARKNTGDNTPPILHTEIVPGGGLRITVLPKGGGAENMSKLAMLKPSQGREGIIDSVLRAVEEAGANPCPPVIVGLGIGGTADKAMLLAKKSLLRPVGQPHPDPEVAELEAELLKKINNLGIGPQGFGGRITALAVHAEVFPTHIASLPVAVNLQCHSARHREATL
jgi:fumarate hydratase subunit alpha